jgi:cation:H+ antiporter
MNNTEISVSKSAHTKLFLSIIWVIGGLILLVLGSKALVVGAIRLARGAGVSEAIIGLTIVSAGTSLPELATSIVAAFRRQPDIAVGNIVGSNIFNILTVLGVSSLLVPYSAPGLTSVDLAVMFGFAVVALPFMWTKFTLSRTEGFLFLGGYGIYLWYLWPR